MAGQARGATGAFTRLSGWQLPRCPRRLEEVARPLLHSWVDHPTDCWDIPARQLLFSFSGCLVAGTSCESMQYRSFRKCRNDGKATRPVKKDTAEVKRALMDYQVPSDEAVRAAEIYADRAMRLGHLGYQHARPTRTIAAFNFLHRIFADDFQQVVLGAGFRGYHPERALATPDHQARAGQDRAGRVD